MSAVELVLADQTGVCGQTRDISEGGLLVVADANLAPNTRMGTYFSVPVKNFLPVPVSVNAEVTYCAYSGNERGFKLGLKFLDVSSASALLIRRYINAFAEDWR